VGPLPKEPETFQEHLEQLEPWESHLLESLVWNTQAGVTAQDVATLIATEKFRVASDGAADPLTGRGVVPKIDDPLFYMALLLITLGNFYGRSVRRYTPPILKNSE
jgi:hypothetical protein